MGDRNFYLRDASFSASSKAGGAMPRYHAMGKPGWSACSAGARSILLIVEDPVDAGDLRADEVCQRKQCREAHAEAVVHRDLKPENIMRRRAARSRR